MVTLRGRVTYALASLLSSCSALQPVESATRTKTSLCGVWQLTVANVTLASPVPSSFDELVPGLPEGFAGVGTYTRKFRVPASLLDGKHRLVLRFDSANYHASVFVNGVELVRHSFAGMPFEAELPVAMLVNGGSAADEHSLRVDVDNIRSWQTLPPGIASTFHGQSVNLVWEGLYNYAGLDGCVHLLSMPRRAYVSDVETVTASIERIEGGMAPAASDDGALMPAVAAAARLAYNVVLAGDAPTTVGVGIIGMLTFSSPPFLVDAVAAPWSGKYSTLACAVSPEHDETFVLPQWLRCIHTIMPHTVSRRRGHPHNAVGKHSVCIHGDWVRFHLINNFFACEKDAESSHQIFLENLNISEVSRSFPKFQIWRKNDAWSQELRPIADVSRGPVESTSRRRMPTYAYRTNSFRERTWTVGVSSDSV